MKKVLFASIASAMGMAAVSGSAQAALASNALLDFADGTIVCNAGAGTPPGACTYGTNVPTGSYFGMDTNGNGTIQNAEKNALTSAGGVAIGVAQGVGDIDVTWSFGGNPGNHYTQSAITAVTDDNAGNATLDMSGWTVNWNGGDIDMGQGADATLTCGTDCSLGDSFVLDYSATVPSGGFAGFFYTLHLEGTIDEVSAVPVPAAVWLFGSGLMGLVGVARRKKAA